MKNNFDSLDQTLMSAKTIFAHFSKFDLDKRNLVMQALEESLQIKDDSLRQTVFEEALKRLILTSITQKLEKQDFSVLNSYLTEHMKVESDIKKEVVKLSKLLTKVNYTPNLEFAMKCLNQFESIQQMIKTLVETNLSILKKGQMDFITDDSFIVLLIEAYCMIHQIETMEEPSSEIDLSIYGLKYHKILSAEEEEKICFQILQGSAEAKQTLMEHNYRLVLSIANQFLNRGLDFDDLFQEGVIGLMKAVDRFDITKGYRFSTYATWWIRQSINRATMEMGRNVRIGINRQELFKKRLKKIEEIEQAQNKKLTIKEIAEALHLSFKEVIETKNYLKNEISLNFKIGDANLEVGDIVLSEEPGTEELAIQSCLKLEAQKLLENSNLTKQERFVLDARFGLNGEECQTLEAISMHFQVSKERIRQIEAKALQKCRPDNWEETDWSTPNLQVDIAVLFQICFNQLQYFYQINNVSPEICEHQKQMYTLLKECGLKGNELEVVSWLVGFYDGAPKTIQELQEYFHTTEKGIKQITLSAFSHLRQSPSYLKLIDHVKKMQYDMNELIDGNNKTTNPITPRKKRLGRKLQSIYELLNHYNKEQIDTVISLLDENEHTTLNLRYGPDLEHPHTSPEFDTTEKTRFYSHLVPKMRDMLSELYGNENPNKNNSDKQLVLAKK